MHDGSGLFAQLATVPNPGEEDFARAAADAFERGDDRLALQQVAAALSFSPLRPDLLHLLEQTLARQASPDDAYAPLLRGHPFFGFHAADAWAKARSGRVGAALAVLLQVAGFRPDIPYLRWAERWIVDRGTRGISAVDVLPHLRRFVSRAVHAPPGHATENVESAIRITHALRKDRPTAASDFALVESALLRHLGFVEQAIEVCEAHAEKATFELWIELAAGRRAMGRQDQAAAAFQAAAEARPGDRAVWIDLGDTSLDAGRPEQAARAYDAAAAIAATSAYDATLAVQARAGALYARIVASGEEPAARAELERLAEESECARELFRDLSNYRTSLPPLAGPAADSVRTFAAGLTARPPARARVLVELDEPPTASVAWAFRAVAAASATGTGVAFVADGREVKEPAELRTITDVTVISSISKPFDADTWIVGSPLLAPAEIRELLAHGAPPSSADPIAELFALRIALLAQAARAAEQSDDAWRCITDEASSADAWRVAAAAVVLGAVARSGGDRRPDAAARVAELAASSEDDAVVHVAATVALTLPGLSQEARRTALRRKRAVEERRPKAPRRTAAEP